METLKIETGKYYSTRGGHKVRIYATDGTGNYPIHGAVFYNGEWALETWELNGTYSFEIEKSLNDIVGEWEQTAIL